MDSRLSWRLACWLERAHFHHMVNARMREYRSLMRVLALMSYRESACMLLRPGRGQVGGQADRRVNGAPLEHRNLPMLHIARLVLPALRMDRSTFSFVFDNSERYQKDWKRSVCKGRVDGIKRSCSTFVAQQSKRKLINLVCMKSNQY